MGAAREELRGRVRELHPRRTTEALVRSFADHDILTYASAISFQTFFALIPLALTALGLLAALHLQSVWSDDVGPEVRAQVSGAVYTVLDSTVRRVFDSRWVFWATLGTALTVWEVSGAMRAVMTVLDRIYGVRKERGRTARYAVSFGLSALVIVLILGAGAAIVLGHAAGGLVAAILRWPLAAALLLGVPVAVVRWAPSQEREWHWVSFGSALVVVGWLGMSIGFSLYLREIADYETIFGNLATLFVGLEYLYLTAIVFLGGLAIDGITQRD